MTEGVAQGDPNGQSLFVMAYEELGDQIDQARADNIKMDFTIPKHLIKEAVWPPRETITMHQHMYIDDHAEIHVTQEPTHIANLITPILQIQQE